MKNKKKNPKFRNSSKAKRSSQTGSKIRKKQSGEDEFDGKQNRNCPQTRKRRSDTSVEKKNKKWKRSVNEPSEIEIVSGSTSAQADSHYVDRVLSKGEDNLKTENDASDNPFDFDEVKETRKLVMQQNRKKKKSGGFQSFGLGYKIYKGIIRKGYNIPTPIQRKTIPLILEGKDIVAMARTGSGKTAAFLVPMFEKLKTHSGKSGSRALILSPTRELALQTLKFSKELGKFTDLRAAVILGGDKIDDQFQAFHQNPDIIIATPGRLLHILVEMELQLKSVEYVVFDEADRLFEMGFSEQLHEIINRLPENRQTLLFSATLPKLLVEFAKAGLHDPTLIRLDIDMQLSEQLKLSFIKCNNDSKLPSLLYLLQNVIKPTEQTFVFAPTKHHVEYLNLVLQKAGISCSYIYSSLDQTARKIAVGKFQNKKVQVLIVTDLAARGIDIPLLDNVINYNFPFKPKLFVHRVGRVARAGRSGTAYTFVGSDESAYLLDLHLFLGRSVKLMDLDGQNKNENGLCGRVPQTIVDDYHDNLIQWEKESIDIKNMTKVCSNAYKQYIKSRPVASHESIVRAKVLDRTEAQIGYLPIFAEGPNRDIEEERLKFLNALRGFKGETTVFEISSTKKNKAFDVMREKRAYHGGKIEKNITQKIHFTNTESDDVSFNDDEQEDDLNEVFQTVVSSKKRKWKDISSQKSIKKHEVLDEENYLHYKPMDYQSEKGLSVGASFEKDIEGATFDLTGDDEKGFKRINNQLRWDRKKKKFIHGDDLGSETKKKKIKTESGTWISASYKSSAYKDWKERTKVEERDETENDKLGKRSSKKFSVLGSKGRRWHVAGSQDIPGVSARKNKFKGSRNELKRPEQILKERRKQQKRAKYQQKASSKKAARKKFSAQMAKKKK